MLTDAVLQILGKRHQELLIEPFLTCFVHVSDRHGSPARLLFLPRTCRQQEFKNWTHSLRDFPSRAVQMGCSTLCLNFGRSNLSGGQ